MDMRNEMAPVRALVVGDAEDGGLADRLAVTLRAPELEITRAPGRAEAEELAAAGIYDVILLTAGQSLDGALSFLDRTRTETMPDPGPKLILASAGADAAELEAAGEAGIDEVLAGAEATASSIRRALRHLGEVRRLESRLAELALFDRLTGLPSQLLFWQFLDRAVQRAQRYDERFAVMSVYVEGLATLNAEGGWERGNRALAVVGRRLRDTLRGADTVARFAGPKFSLMIEAVREDADAHLVACRLMDVLSAPITETPGAAAPLTATIGIALFPTTASSAQDLLHASIAAMDRGKEHEAGGIHFA